MTQSIHESFKYTRRHEKGIQDPLVTLDIGSGSCRDLAVLMIEGVRSLGMAARFVSGYLHVRNSGSSRGGHTHAWAQVYLPGCGWVDFDPSGGTVGNRGLIRVAVVRDPRQATPLSGVWFGRSGDNLEMKVEVRVTASDASEGLGAHGADVNSKEQWRRQTPLMWAVAESHPEMAQELIAHGADVNAAATNGTGYNALTGAVTSGHTEMAAWLLENGANPNYRYGPGYTPLLAAAANGRVEIVKALLARGAELHAKSNDGKTALALADERKHSEVAALLRSRGAA